MAEPLTQQHFEQIIAGLSCTDNHSRNLAEQQYETIPLQLKATHLFTLYLDNAAAKDNRSMALVLLRRVISSNPEEFWTAIGSAGKEQFHAQILKCIEGEKDAVLKKRLTDVIAELARNTISRD